MDLRTALCTVDCVLNSFHDKSSQSSTATLIISADTNIEDWEVKAAMCLLYSLTYSTLHSAETNG